jgi:hypothetical protein
VSEIADTATRAEVAKRLDEKGARKRQHRKGCAWKVNHSPDELYAQLRRMVHPPTVANLGLLKAALEEECEGLDRIRWTSPLVSEHGSTEQQARRWAGLLMSSLKKHYGLSPPHCGPLYRRNNHPPCPHRPPRQIPLLPCRPH